MNKLANLIERLPLEELEMIKKDLSSGNMENLINKKINTYKRDGDLKICPVCHNDVCEDTDKILIFGPRGLRKKAIFCANDCLDYFLNKLKVQDEIIMRKNENGTC